MKTNWFNLMAALGGVALLSAACAATPSRRESFSDWPAGSAPAEVGRRVAENYAARKFEFETNPRRKTIIYPEVCAWYGALQVAALTGDTNLQERLVRRFDFFLMPPGAERIATNAHVDSRVFGALPLEIYRLDKNRACLDLGAGLADAQWENPTGDGITREARYWVDDMFMIPALQVQAWRATGDSKYLDRAALTEAAYLDRLQQPGGLFFHAEDSPFYWARGNGWFAAGMTELLRELPPEHPRYGRILAGYKKMMAALVRNQCESGLWRQLIDQPSSWEETSGTGMFAYALVTGVKRGWLDEKKFGPAARKAWLALVAQLDADGNLKNVCVGTNKGAKEVGDDRQKQLAFYLARGRETGNLHGQAPVLWTAAALLR